MHITSRNRLCSPGASSPFIPTSVTSVAEQVLTTFFWKMVRHHFFTGLLCVALCFALGANSLSFGSHLQASASRSPVSADRRSSLYPIVLASLAAASLTVPVVLPQPAFAGSLSAPSYLIAKAAPPPKEGNKERLCNVVACSSRIAFFFFTCMSCAPFFVCAGRVWW